ncbi:hypothetical protein GBAR_LOCUS19389 [Geodia barretti]|jgi:hypothetical protein|uniref:Uncharacterized protein n=1 Tax=Geodia barretti TaxID=519541 RepID=A0AA35SQK9_GEOBA|nr:hypothetical protein GBAR_LOCUS19389 [Geodia barretti]
MHYITTALATLAVALAIALRSVNAYGNGGLSADVCNTFGVYHEANRRPDTSKDVYLTLFGENGEPQNCFMPQRNYYGEFRFCSCLHISMNVISNFYFCGNGIIKNGVYLSNSETEFKLSHTRVSASSSVRGSYAQP